MAISIKDLLRYKREVKLRDSRGDVVGTVWVRLLGDEDLNLAYRLGRVRSNEFRKALRNPETLEYREQISPLEDQPRTELESAVIQANRQRFQNEAYVHVDREEPIKIQEIAELPDAPTLEEQEILDKKLTSQVEDYQKRIQEYIEGRVKTLEAELLKKTDAEILEDTKKEMVSLLPIQTFLVELNSQKAFRGTYDDKECRKRTFETEEDFANTNSSIKEQIISAYLGLEISPDDVKN